VDPSTHFVIDIDKFRHEEGFFPCIRTKNMCSEKSFKLWTDFHEIKKPLNFLFQYFSYHIFNNISHQGSGGGLKQGRKTI